MENEKQLFQQAREIMNRVDSGLDNEDKEQPNPDVETEEVLEDEVVESPTALVTPTEIKTPLPWKVSNQTKKNVATSRSVFNMEHGILSGVPIICRTYQCPYRETCWIDEADLKYGERCPIEIAAIMDRYEKYKEELIIRDKDDIDKGLLKELVDIEVMLLRCDNLLATKGSLIDEIVSTVGEDGTAYYKPEIAKEAELKDRLRKERHRILQLLNSTRKDRKQEAEFTDPSSMVSNLIQKLKQMEPRRADVVEAEFSEMDENKESGEE